MSVAESPSPPLLQLNQVEIVDTFAEAFRLRFTRLIVTADPGRATDHHRRQSALGRNRRTRDVRKRDQRDRL